jgi:hypothetical protein
MLATKSTGRALLHEAGQLPSAQLRRRAGMQAMRRSSSASAVRLCPHVIRLARMNSDELHCPFIRTSVPVKTEAQLGELLGAYRLPAGPNPHLAESQLDFRPMYIAL